jgi:hypothetical protein
MTKTELRRRLSTLRTQAVARTGAPRNARTEIGLRACPVNTLAHPTTAEAYPPGDDLVDFIDLGDYVKYSASPGDVVHLYLSYPNYGELFSVVVGWLGTNTEPPALIDIDGRPV